MQGMQLAAHASAKCSIDQFVLGNSHFALECGGDDMRGIVITVSGEICDRHFGIRQGGLDQCFNIRSGHRHQG